MGNKIIKQDSIQINNDIFYKISHLKYKDHNDIVHIITVREAKQKVKANSIHRGSDNILMIEMPEDISYCFYSKKKIKV